MTLPAPLDSQFELLRTLGKGGMGEVFLCRDPKLSREVAVKVLRGADEGEQRHRFLREADALARLKHPNILTVYDSGMASGWPYLVMEYLQGRSLDALGPGQDPIPPLLQVAEGLEEVHRAGLIHRDVKPANMVLTDQGRAVLVDFGLVFDPRRTSITKERKFTGTMAFLAPEVLQGSEPDAHDSRGGEQQPPGGAQHGRTRLRSGRRRNEGLHVPDDTSPAGPWPSGVCRPRFPGSEVVLLQGLIYQSLE